MTDLSDFADMASLIREEEEKLFGEKVLKIKACCASHDKGKLMHSELISLILGVIND